MHSATCKFWLGNGRVKDETGYLKGMNAIQEQQQAGFEITVWVPGLQSLFSSLGVRPVESKMRDDNFSAHKTFFCNSEGEYAASFISLFIGMTCKIDRFDICQRQIRSGPQICLLMCLCGLDLTGKPK